MTLRDLAAIGLWVPCNAKNMKMPGCHAFARCGDRPRTVSQNRESMSRLMLGVPSRVAGRLHMSTGGGLPRGGGTCFREVLQISSVISSSRESMAPRLLRFSTLPSAPACTAYCRFMHSDLGYLSRVTVRGVEARNSAREGRNQHG